MFRFMAVCFLFLGWAFWELSGGADFEPGVTALAAEPESVEETQLAATPVADTVTRNAVAETLSTQSTAPQMTLAATAPTTEASAAPQVAEQVAAQVTAAVQEVAPSLDLRKINGNRVNMRQGPGTEFGVVTKLSEGAEVEVLEEPGNGWLKLRVVSDNTEGWIADWLVTSSS